MSNYHFYYHYILLVVAYFAITVFISGCLPKESNQEKSSVQKQTKGNLTSTPPKTVSPKKTAPPSKTREARVENIEGGIQLTNYGFTVPGAAIYDAKRDVYLVSNTNADPMSANNDGFISRIHPSGRVEKLKWIAGGQKGIVLQSPKGMAIRNDTLYATDITVVRKFDLETGSALGEIKIQGATYLNDISTAPDGLLYVSDSGYKAGKGLVESGSDAIYTIDRHDIVKKLLAGTMLRHPNGVAADKNGVYVAAFGKPVVYYISKEGKISPMISSPEGPFDGIMTMPDGRLLVSSWDKRKILQKTPDNRFVTLIDVGYDPADFGYDSKRGKVIIPLFRSNALQIRELPSAPPTKTKATP